MSEFLDPSSESDGTARTVDITDASAFQMPQKCVVCGTDASEPMSYTQDHRPIVAPGIAFIRTTQLAIPYCAEHREAFQKRFRVLRIAQGVMYVVLVVWAFTLRSESLRLSLGWDPRPGVASYLFGGAVLLVLAATIFCIKPRLYDVFIKRSGDRLQITSRSNVFIQNVIKANQTIVE